MQAQALLPYALPLPPRRIGRTPVDQLALSYVGVMRPHVGHQVVCVIEDGKPVVRCTDCGENVTDIIFSPVTVASLAAHAGHLLTCESRELEVYVVCESCCRDIVASVPF